MSISNTPNLSSLKIAKQRHTVDFPPVYDTLNENSPGFSLRVSNGKYFMVDAQKSKTSMSYIQSKSSIEGTKICYFLKSA